MNLMKNLKRIIAFMLLVSIIFTLSACKFGKSGELDKPDDSSTPVVTEPEEIKITDVLGREVVLSEPAKK